MSAAGALALPFPTVARPRFMTPRTPSRRTRGREVARTMMMLGWEPHPWQLEALDVLYEVDDDGRLVYGMGIMLVPRRAGKTSIGLGSIVHRGHAFPGLPAQRSMSNMQSGIDSRAMFLDTWLPTLERSQFAGTFTPVKQISHEQIRWHNGAIHSVRAPKVGGGVGSDLDLWLNDEAWHLEDTSYESAILPTMGTRTDAMSLVLSMAGDASSGYLIGKRDLGRSLVELGANTGTFYLEYSAHEDADPLDEDVWRATHPALGHTLTIERLRQYAQSMSIEDFAKEFLGIWPTNRAETVIDMAMWMHRADAADRRRSHRGSQIAGPVALAIDVEPSRERSSISAAGFRSDELAHVEVIRNDRGVDWVVAEAAKINAKLPPGSRWGLDSRSAAASLEPELLKKGIKPIRLGLNDAVKSAALFYDGVKDDWLRHIDQPSLNESVAAAARRAVQGVWAWKRTPGVDSTPLISASQALWLAVQPPDDKDREYGWRPWELNGDN